MTGAYVPPHLRNKPPPTPRTPNDRLTSSITADSSAASRSSQPRAGPSRSQTPWSRSDTVSALPSKSSTEAWPSYDAPPPASPSSYRYTNGTSSSSNRNPAAASGSPSLYVYGDSFVGPMKLLSDDCVKVQTFKGASAKGLNNPNSAKQVATQLTPLLNDLLAPPPYRYVPSSGRYTLLVFGNVDLQINYLWQLQNKTLSELSFPRDQTQQRQSNGARSTTNGDTDTEDDPPPDTSSSSQTNTVLARATETSLTGPALGPELFVKAVIYAYTSYLQHQVIDGPVGQRLRESAEKRRRIDSGEEKGRLPPLGKVFVAAALPPLVEDSILARIPEKYVERLEEDHQKAQDLLRTSSSAGAARATSRANGLGRTRLNADGIDALEVGVSTLGMTDCSPSGTVASESPQTAHSMGAHRVPPTASTSIGSTTPSSSSPPTSAPSLNRRKTSIEALLQHDPPLCTLPVRIRMTQQYNALLQTFCAQYPDVLQFIDISTQMHHIDKTSGYAPVESGQVDRATWACPVDPTNVHPLWEPTLPLWLNELAKHGVKTEAFKMSEGAEETFRAYELDKRRRTADRFARDNAEAAAAGGRVKIRDE